MPALVPDDYRVINFFSRPVNIPFRINESIQSAGVRIFSLHVEPGSIYPAAAEGQEIKIISGFGDQHGWPEARKFTTGIFYFRNTTVICRAHAQYLVVCAVSHNVYPF